MKTVIKNIIYLASNRLDRRSADIVNIMEMCNAFSKQGLNISLIVPDCDLTEKELFSYYGIGFPFQLIPIKIPKLLKKKIIPGLSTVFSLSAISIIKRLEFDLVYTRTPWIFFLVSALYRKPCFFEAHQFRYEGLLTQFLYRLLIKMGAKKDTSKIICISKMLMRQWKNYGIKTSSLYVAHDGVNIEKFHNAISKKEARQRLGLNPNQFIVAYTGSFLPGKGISVLVKAANRLPDVKFIIVGGESDQIDVLVKLSTLENIIFTGHIEIEKIPYYQAAADILALPNTIGSVIDDVTSPIKLFEYIASQRPIVSSDRPSLLEILRHMDTALISPAGDERKLAENIKLLFQNPILGEKLAKNAGRDLTKYSWNARASYLHQLFMDIPQKNGLREKLTGIYNVLGKNDG
ncbi:MAG: glycosyltransferase family 1 protein [Desulfobacteraceae bacterium]|nr:MAG: glycosyltransferase family 1 protein [Desulfobacteraceae bacterium]